jgi:hypothetical protein
MSIARGGTDFGTIEQGGCAESLFITYMGSRTSDANYEVPCPTFAEALATANVVGSLGLTHPVQSAANLDHGQHPEHVSDLQYCYDVMAPVGASAPARQWLEQHGVGLPQPVTRWVDTFFRNDR